jgi:hypothetical protein
LLNDLAYIFKICFSIKSKSILCSSRRCINVKYETTQKNVYGFCCCAYQNKQKIKSSFFFVCLIYTKKLYFTETERNETLFFKKSNETERYFFWNRNRKQKRNKYFSETERKRNNVFQPLPSTAN